MTKDLDLQTAMIAALDEYGYEKKTSTDLEQARNKQQMTKYIKSLDYSLRRLLILQEAVNGLVEEEKHFQAQQESIQTYKTKVINLSRQYNTSYQEILEIMARQESQ